LPCVVALCAFAVSIARAMPSAPAAFVETGAPSFVVLGPEAMGLSAQPTDLHLMPDGRILAVSLRELTLGDGLRWEVYRGIEGQEFIAPEIVVDAKGTIYTGVRGGIATVDLGADARWHLSRVTDFPAVGGISKTTMASVNALGRDWFWFSGSGSIVAWKPGQTARVATTVDNAIEDIFELGPDVFISDQTAGALFRLRPGTDKSERFPPGETRGHGAITCTTPFAPGQVLAGTSFGGIKVFDGQTFQPFGTTPLLGAGHRITDLCAAGDGLFAAAIDTLGIAFFDRTGRIIQVLDRSLDHRLARVKRLLYSPDGVIWALLNDGVARVQFPSPLSHFEPLVASGLVYAKPLRHAGGLWLLTDGRALRGIYDSSHRLERFEEEAPPGHFLFTLNEVDGRLFASNDTGIFVWEDAGWTTVGSGIVNARVGVGRTTSQGIPYVARGEFGWLRPAGSGFTADRHPVAELGDNYNAAQDAAGIIWLELGTSRVGRFDPANGSLEIFGTKDGLSDGWVELYVLDGVARFHLANHLFRFNDAAHRFVEDLEVPALFPANAQPEGRVVSDALGRLWFTAGGIVHVLDRATPGVSKISTVPLGFTPTEYTIEDNGVVWLFERQRLAGFDPRIAAPPRPPLKALITSVEFSASGRWQFAPAEKLAPIDYSDNSLVLHFAAPANPFTSAATFEVMLEGAGSQWVSTGAVGVASFNRLKEGSYVFRVRPVTGEKTYGAEARLAFTVRPPWYRTSLAWVVYACSAIGLVAGAAWFSSFLQRRENERLERLVGERTRELRASEERFRALNVELEARVETRTAELSLSNRELQQRESLFRLIFEHAPVGISWKRSDLGGVYHFNPTFRRILGLRADTTMDHALLFKLVHPDDAARQAEMTRLIDSGDCDTYNLEERFALEDGSVVWGSLSVAVIRDDTDRIIQEIGILEDITLRKRAEQELEATYKNLVATSRVAGMAEVATGVLHNVGNVLNSVNISSNILVDGVRESKTDLLVKLAALVNEHAADLGHFFAHDPKGKLVPEMLTMLAQHAATQQEWLVREVAEMQKNIDHIKEIVAMQQSYATTAGVVETLDAASLFEDALRMNDAALSPHEVTIVREYLPVSPVTVERGKVLQVITNLLHNAKRACDDSGASGPGEKTIVVRVEPGAPDRVRFIVRDNGVGIAPENLTRIFSHGFTTRPGGHGFGLHSSILAAREMKGSLSVHSDGLGRGASFTLELPMTPEASSGRAQVRAAFPSAAQPKATVVRRPDAGAFSTRAG
jgi:PAS domain S-box-containing protein